VGERMLPIRKINSCEHRTYLVARRIDYVDDGDADDGNVHCVP